MDAELAPTSPFSLRRMLAFVRAHLAYLLLAPVIVVLGTLLHELAHALAAVAQGAEIYKIQILPSFDRGYFTFGYVTHSTPPCANALLISLAPTIGSTVVAAGTALLLLGRTPATRWKIVYLAFFVLPIADVALSLGGLVHGITGSDWYTAFHGMEAWILPAAFAALVGSGWLGWRLFLRAVGRRLEPMEFGLGYVLLVGVVPLVRW
jgi:hypothetical protein